MGGKSTICIVPVILESWFWHCWKVGERLISGNYTWPIPVFANQKTIAKLWNQKNDHTKNCKWLITLSDLYSLYTWTIKSPSFAASPSVFSVDSHSTIVARAMWVRAWFAFDGRKDSERRDMIRREGQVGDLNKVRHKDSVWKVPLPTETMCLVIQKSLQKNWTIRVRAHHCLVGLNKFTRWRFYRYLPIYLKLKHP